MDKIKNIIQRALDLKKQYELIEVSYCSIEDGGGQSCENCGKLITNVATIRSEGRNYQIGLDCLDTILENNNRLISDADYLKYQYSDKPAIQKAKGLRAKVLKYAKKYPLFEAKFREFKDRTGKDCFGFNFSEEGETGNFKPLGWDYTFDPEYKTLTLNYIKGIKNVVF